MIFLETQTSLLEDSLLKYIYLPILAWMILVIVYLIFLTKKYTFGKWTKDNPNPYCTETMGLPRGVMRGILTLSLLFGVLLLEIFAIENKEFEDHIKQFIVAFQMMLAFYFGSKVMHHLTSVDRSKTEYVTDSIKQVAETKAAATVSVVESASASGAFNDEEAEG